MTSHYTIESHWSFVRWSFSQCPFVSELVTPWWWPCITEFRTCCNAVMSHSPHPTQPNPWKWGLKWSSKSSWLTAQLKASIQMKEKKTSSPCPLPKNCCTLPTGSTDPCSCLQTSKCLRSPKATLPHVSVKSSPSPPASHPAHKSFILSVTCAMLHTEKRQRGWNHWCGVLLVEGGQLRGDPAIATRTCCCTLPKSR